MFIVWVVSQKEILDSPLFLELYLPVIRNDFQMIGDYAPTLEKVNTPITIINGSDDHVVRNKYRFWNWYSFNQDVISYVMKGNHFFIDSTKDITALINKIL